MSGADVHAQDRATGTWVLGVGNTSRNVPPELGVFTDFTREALPNVTSPKQNMSTLVNHHFTPQNQEWVAKLSSEAPNPQRIVIKCTQ